MPQKLIGGFFELEPDTQGNASESVWKKWTENTSCHLTFKNARSALTYLLQQRKMRKIWLPAYLCPETAPASTPYSLFPADPLGGINLNFIQEHVQAGEAVMLVNYFGVAPDNTTLDFVKSRQDIVWIEDRCHTLWSETTEPYGDWIIYSPRKLIGVPDGGLLVSYKEKIPAPAYKKPVIDIWDPARMRYEDPHGKNNKEWYQAYLKSEAAMKADLQPISDISLEILRNLPLNPMIKMRIQNAEILKKRIKETGKLTTLPIGDVPFCVPVVIEDVEKIAEKLAKQGIFCARHWKTLISPPDMFLGLWKLAGKLLSLPCDHRYNADDMHRIADVLDDILTNTHKEN